MKGKIFIILLFSNVLLFSQSDKIEGNTHTAKIEGHRYWLGFGMNMGVASKESKSLCGSFNVGVNYAEGKSKYEFRYSKLDVDIFLNGRNYDRYNKYALLYGRGIVRKEFYLMVSGGISLNHDVTYYKIRDDIFIWSFPMELELFWKATKYGGFGILFSVDYSPKMSIISLGGRFGFGKL